MSKKRRLLYKDVDALRFLAFLPVFFYCGFYLINRGENAFIADSVVALNYLKQNSIDFFFFLSAFLLTSHALREYKYKKGFSLKAFYVRRILRITPVFVLALVFAFLVHPWIVNTLKLTSISTPSSWSYFVLFPNYFTELTSEQFIYLSVIWTIYMFIQFYFIWGLFLKFFLQQIKYVGFLFIGIGVVSRVYHILIDTPYEFDTLSIGIPVGIGAIVANAIRNDDRLVENIKHSPKANHLLVYGIAIVTLLGGYLFLGKTYAVAIIPIITCSALGYIIIEQTFSKNSIFKFRKSKILSRLGKISYGLIVYQSIIMVVGVISVESLEFDISSIPTAIGLIILSFLLSWLVADFSYNWYERPILSFKKDFKKV